MSGDYSRIRFDASNDIAGVMMQQGRVQLDSDWNEWVEALDRRTRAESIDTFGVHTTPGITGVAIVSPQTPDAFMIDAAGGNISIGRGRMYVDGLLAENHGGGTVEFDAVLAELRGSSALDYYQQAYFPAPPALPAGGPHLAYLEVWQRELTYLQQGNLLEIAVGVDTTTRLQTVWQVRLLADVGSINCSTPDAAIPGWQALTLPSGGRMSIKAEGVPPDLDPCELPPGGGYRGLENQLYRIEIHDGGAGAATFKWSRDNASVSSNVVEVIAQTATSSELKLANLGRDAVLRFNTGDWVEIIDDRLELSGENGDPALRRGVMRKITVNDDTQSISFSPALPAYLIPGGGTDTLDARHTRVLRWDQKGTVRDANGNMIVDLDAPGSSGLIPVPAPGVWVVIENGIQIQFSLDPSGGGYRSADYWQAAARSANTSVETYTARPPRGIHRHYARLAIVTFPDSESDCRVHWPPESGGCCTLNVQPGESIQSALDSLPEAGGCVCLKTGVHNISATILIAGSHIILRGESPGTIVRASGLSSSLQIGAVEIPVSDIVVEGIRFEASTESDMGMLLNLLNCSRVRVSHCALSATLVTGQTSPALVGINLSNVNAVELLANRMDNLLIGILSSDYQDGLSICDNAIAGISGSFLGQSGGSSGQYGISIDSDHTQACRIENNRIRDFWTGIYLHSAAADSVIAGNRISRSAGNSNEKPPTDVAEMRQYLDSRLYAIDVEAARCMVRDNFIDLRSAAWGGIRVSGTNCVVAGNNINASALKATLVQPVGIYCLADSKNGNSADYSLVNGNLLRGPQSGIYISRISHAVVADNLIAGGGWYGVRVDACSDCRLLDNNMDSLFFAVHLSDGARNEVSGNRIDQAATGITSAPAESDLKISNNTLQSCMVLGIVVFVRGTTVLLKNRLFNCGYLSLFSVGIGVYDEEVWAPSGAHLRIEGCEVVDTGISADGSQVSTLGVIGMGGWMPACQISGNHIGYTQTGKLDALKEHRALLLIGPLALYYATGPGEIAYMFGSAQINNNHFHGPGRTHLVEFMRIAITPNIDLRFEKLSFSNNNCDHIDAEANSKNASIGLWGGHLIVMGNHVKAAPNVNAMSLANRNKITLMGNITTGDYINTGVVTPLPIANFNVKI